MTTIQKGRHVMKQPLLQIERLSKNYGATKALKNISLTIHEGEFVAIIGPSGAGKSTFIRCLNRLIEPSEGTIQLNDTNIVKARGQALRSVRTNIAMIFQNYNLVERSSVLENVLHGRLGHMTAWQSFWHRYEENDKRRAINLLKHVGLEREIWKRADDLSGGQKQRVGVCRALLQEPSLILADEPIASLDPTASQTVMDILHSECKNRNIACLVNLHQVDVAKRYADRIIGIRSGEVVLDTSPSQLTEDMIHRLYEVKTEPMVQVGGVAYGTY